MQVLAQHTNARIAPRKVRVLTSVIVGEDVKSAQAQLTWQTGKAAQLLGAVLKSAVANATNNFEIEPDNLRVASLSVNDGMKFKRFQPVSRGSGHPFVKRTSNIKLVIEEIKKTSGTGKGHKTEIETLEVEDFVKSRGVQAKVDVSKADAKGAGREDTGSDAELEVSGKIKSAQQGGNRKKTHRRKSI